MDMKLRKILACFTQFHHNCYLSEIRVNSGAVTTYCLQQIYVDSLFALTDIGDLLLI